MKNRHSFFILFVLTFFVVFTYKSFAQERNLVLHNVSIVSVSAQYGNSFSTVKSASGQTLYFWSKLNQNYRDVMSESMGLSSENKVFDIYYYNDQNQLKWGITWMYAYGIGYQNRQYYIETGKRVR